jgi:hypothetical protein
MAQFKNAIECAANPFNTKLDADESWYIPAPGQPVPLFPPKLVAVLVPPLTPQANQLLDAFPEVEL